jgi:hypothetical protein
LAWFIQLIAAKNPFSSPPLGSGFIFSAGYIGREKAKAFLDEVENDPAALAELRAEAKSARSFCRPNPL